MGQQNYYFITRYMNLQYMNDKRLKHNWAQISTLKTTRGANARQSKKIFYVAKSILFVCLYGFLTSSSTTRLYRGRAPRQERLTILRAATHETELGDHDFCLSRSHYTDTDPTCRERAATAGIEPGTSSPVARSTAELPRPPLSQSMINKLNSVYDVPHV